MKLLSFALAAGLASLGLAQEEAAQKISLEIGFPEAPIVGSRAELMNDKEAILELTVTNNENVPITIAGFGGSFYEPNSKEDKVYTNLTMTKLEADTTVQPNSQHKIQQRLSVQLPPYDFDLAVQAFALLASEQESNGIALIESSNRARVSIVDPPVSWFDPRLILAIALLLASVTISGYYLVTLIVLPYISGSPMGKPVEKKPAKVESSQARSSGVQPGEKGYDESWIPEHHLKQSKRRTKKN
ncbi:hypothetical protein TRVA0_022S01970 [Trichomonascus vanleenenianus]|uniref:Irc22p n=1 Tax=Trichomonascus vanleenenianus TaxID=2268995 RepID=UPI003ECAD2C9